MILNALYGSIINNYNLCGKLKLSGISVKEKAPPGKIPFVVLSLPVPTANVIAGTSHEITEHHVSVYSQQDDRIQVFSNYHYTATLTDGSKLRVYFDRRDNVIGDPILTDGSLTSDENYFIKNHAIATTHSLLVTLRENHFQAVATLSAAYKETSTKLEELSKDFETQHVEYIELLSKQIETARTLAKLQYDAKCLNGILSNMCNIEKKIKEKYSVSKQAKLKPIEVELPQSDKYESTYSQEKQSLLQPVIKKISSKPKEHPIDMLKTEISNFEKEFDKLELPSKIKLLSSIFQKINDISWFENSQCSVEQLIFLKNKHAMFNKKGEILLRCCILQQKFVEARGLVNFIDGIVVKMLELALYMNKPAIADFILEHSDMPLNSMLFSPTASVQKLAVMYCFEHQSPKKDYTELLTVLINHGASIVISYDDGLPLAHHILSTRNHPLQQALLNANLFNDANFCQQLAITIKLYKATNKMSYEKKNNLLRCIERYGLLKDDIMLVLKQGICGVDDRIKLIKSSLQSYNNLFTQDLNKDSDVIAVQSQLLEKCKEYNDIINKLLPALKKQVLKSQQKCLRQILDDDGSSSHLASILTKEECLELIKKDILIVENEIQVINSEIEIQQLRQKQPSKRSNRAIKLLCEKQEEQRTDIASYMADKMVLSNMGMFSAANRRIDRLLSNTEPDMPSNGSEFCDQMLSNMRQMNTTTIVTYMKFLKSREDALQKEKKILDNAEKFCSKFTNGDGEDNSCGNALADDNYNDAYESYQEALNEYLGAVKIGEKYKNEGLFVLDKQLRANLDAALEQASDKTLPQKRF